MTNRTIAFRLGLLIDAVKRVTEEMHVVILALAQEVEAFKRARKRKARK